MIPAASDDLIQDFGYTELPSRTFKLNAEEQTLTGQTDSLEAVKQAIYLILHVERYEYIIYSWNYGIELQDLFGQDPNYVIPELKRRITEALLQDSRILNVYDFTFSKTKRKILATFKVETIFGEVQAQREVNV